MSNVRTDEQNSACATKAVQAILSELPASGMDVVSSTSVCVGHLARFLEVHGGYNGERVIDAIAEAAKVGLRTERAATAPEASA